MNSLTKLDNNVIEIAKKVLNDESEAIKSLINTIDEKFEECVNFILASKGKLIITGIGKSAIIAQKIVATLNSTGQKSIFMHAADALHGDLGLVDAYDVVCVISKSGNTPEIKVLLPMLKLINTNIICIVSDINSYLAVESKFVLNAHVKKEACPLNLAPTNSTTAALAMGDALAMCLLSARNFNTDDFAKYHPGGSLGKKLYLKVEDFCHLHETPKVKNNASFREVLLEISSKRLGSTAVIDENGILSGIITDGDLRRIFETTVDTSNLKAEIISNKHPKTINYGDYAVNALTKMKEFSVSQLIVLKNDSIFGFIHLHDLLKEGLI